MTTRYVLGERTHWSYGENKPPFHYVDIYVIKENAEPTHQCLELPQEDAELLVKRMLKNES